MKQTMLKMAAVAMLALPAAHAADHAGSYAVQQKWTLDGAGRWDYLEVDSSQQRLFVTRDERVQVLDLASGKVAGEIPGLKRAHGVAFAPALGLGFASSGAGDSVVVFELDSLKVKREVKVAGKNPDAILFHPASGKLYVFNGKSANVTVFDAATMQQLASIAVNGKPEFAVADDKRIYVNIEDKNAIAVIDVASDSVVANWGLAGCDEPTGLAFDATHQRLFSVCGNGVLAVTDAASGKAVARRAIGKGADAAVYDAQRQLVFSSNGEGTLTVIHQTDADHYGVPVTLPTLKGARTMAMDHASGRIYLPVLAEQRFSMVVVAP
ncbi:YncE family protein [Duganella qianjiadongensis]|uniref:YncE family protein n=1 Tax=Duganella qianjiadongensis TaxID=2692176 RepID=A0ABW9VSG8_9BURK|nr:YncE family protein [Duganella qianjiadongensis]MYM41192.1 YncE family protein [Duganella qianjiadongensis]